MVGILGRKFASQLLLTICVIIVCFAPPPAEGGTPVTKTFRKVKMRTLFKVCLLETHARVYGTDGLTLEECGSKCIRNSTCVLFCFSEGGKQCVTTTVFNTDWFPGISEESDSKTVTYDVCYSSWASPFNIVTDTMATTSTAPTNTERTKELAIDGYYCHAKYYEARRFDAGKRMNNFWQLDLGDNVLAREIRIAQSILAVAFNGVTVRFGPSATSTSNGIIAEFAAPDPRGDLRILLDPPVQGRYLHFLQAAYSYLSLGEIQIIPDN